MQKEYPATGLFFNIFSNKCNPKHFPKPKEKENQRKKDIFIGNIFLNFRSV